MPSAQRQIHAYFEVGKRKTFAGAIEWPGWCRSGRDEAAALQALLEYGPRYALALNGTGLGFETPSDVHSFEIVEQLEGNSTTDFGAPAMPPSGDGRPVGEDEIQRLEVILNACWQAFDAAVETASGKELRKGPRGGGRDLITIVEHVAGADEAYLRRIGWKPEKVEGGDPDQVMVQLRQAILDGLGAAARGELPAEGPRGGIRWSPRYFVRRVAWHTLDHAWEIEDRVL